MRDQNRLLFGGREEIRTPDPLLAKQVLSQLSYTPTAQLLHSKAFPKIPESFVHLPQGTAPLDSIESV
jgi:hypothetical protein